MVLDHSEPIHLEAGVPRARAPLRHSTLCSRTIIINTISNIIIFLLHELDLRIQGLEAALSITDRLGP